MARQFIYHMAGLNKAYGNKKVLENIHLSFYPDAKIGILGPNGAGKSTVLRIMAGLDKEFTGEAWLAEGATVGYLRAGAAARSDQDRARERHGRRRRKKADPRALQRADDELFRRDGGRGAKLQDDHRQPEPLGSRKPGRDGDGGAALPAAATPTSTSLSGGERRRVALCRLLLSQPDLLLLDEPTNHLDAETIAWLEKHLRDYPGAVLIITHDRYFLDNVTGWILELDRGRGIPYEGNYSAYLHAKAKRMQQEGREEARPPEGDLRASRNGSPPARRPARPSPRRVSRAYDELVGGRREAHVPATRRSSSRSASASARSSSRSRA